MKIRQKMTALDTHLFVSLTFFCHALMSARPLSGLNAFTGPANRVRNRSNFVEKFRLQFFEFMKLDNLDNFKSKDKGVISAI